MKYMGSKRWMLENGLGELLLKEAKRHKRFVDLFCGAGSVSWFAAQQLGLPVLAVDLQTYAAVLTGAVIERTIAINADDLWRIWKPKIIESREQKPIWKLAAVLDSKRFNTATWSKRARELCEANQTVGGIIWKAYGGYYFSPTQALSFDAMLDSLPSNEPIRSVCLASVIIAASHCVASPGHTAQPFKATRRSAKFLREAWLRNPLDYVQKALKSLCLKYAKVRGEAKIGDAVEIAATLENTDLVFVDPPYSGVHYSRFYHVLETIARGNCGSVKGVGRYPPPDERPVSSFSRKTESEHALRTLLEHLAQTRSTVVFTFPAGECSNGLSGKIIEQVANRWFSIQKKIVRSRFSTLGGNNSHRNARKVSKEMILLLRPK